VPLIVGEHHGNAIDKGLVLQDEENPVPLLLGQAAPMRVQIFLLPFALPMALPW